MNKFILTAVAVLCLTFATEASATNPHNNNNSTQNSSESNSNANSNSSSSANANSTNNNSVSVGGSKTNSNSNSVATGGNSNATGGVGVGVGGSAVGHGGAGGSASGGTASANGNVTTNVTTDNDVAASTAYAAPLVAGDDTCMGSTSGGAQGVGFGVSLGTTYTDEDCVRRKDATFLHNIGLTEASVALMCQKDDVRAAVVKTGNRRLIQLCLDSVSEESTIEQSNVTPARRASVNNSNFNE